jgi:hypothetical protein
LLDTVHFEGVLGGEVVLDDTDCNSRVAEAYHLGDVAKEKKIAVHENDTRSDSVPAGDVGNEEASEGEVRREWLPIDFVNALRPLYPVLSSVQRGKRFQL